MSALFTYQVRLISAILDLSFLKQVLSTRQMKKVLILKKSSYICTIFQFNILCACGAVRQSRICRIFFCSPVIKLQEFLSVAQEELPYQKFVRVYLSIYLQYYTRYTQYTCVAALPFAFNLCIRSLMMQYLFGLFTQRNTTTHKHQDHQILTQDGARSIV